MKSGGLDEIGGDLDVVDVDIDIVDNDCDGEDLRNFVTEVKSVSAKEGEGDGLVNEGDEFSSTRIGRTVFTDNDVYGEGAGEEDEEGLEFFFVYRQQEHFVF